MVLGATFKKNNMEEVKERHTGLMTAVWVLAGAVVLGFLVYLWQQGCNEKVRFAHGMSELAGRVNALEPAVTAQGNNLYQVNGVLSATVQGTKDFKECAINQLFQLNDTVFYNPRAARANGCGSCGDGNRVFKQTSTYNLASTSVTVDDYCRN